MVNLLPASGWISSQSHRSCQDTAAHLDLHLPSFTALSCSTGRGRLIPLTLSSRPFLEQLCSNSRGRRHSCPSPRSCWSSFTACSNWTAPLTRGLQMHTRCLGEGNKTWGTKTMWPFNLEGSQCVFSSLLSWMMTMGRKGFSYSERQHSPPSMISSTPAWTKANLSLKGSTKGPKKWPKHSRVTKVPASVVSWAKITKVTT